MNLWFLKFAKISSNIFSIWRSVYSNLCFYFFSSNSASNNYISSVFKLALAWFYNLIYLSGLTEIWKCFEPCSFPITNPWKNWFISFYFFSKYFSFLLLYYLFNKNYWSKYFLFYFSFSTIEELIPITLSSEFYYEFYFSMVFVIISSILHKVNSSIYGMFYKILTNFLAYAIFPLDCLIFIRFIKDSILILVYWGPSYFYFSKLSIVYMIYVNIDYALWKSLFLWKNNPQLK